MIKIKLKQILFERDMKPTPFAFKIGVDPSTILRYYHNKAQLLDPKVISKICKTLKCTIDDLFEYVPDSTNP